MLGMWCVCVCIHLSVFLSVYLSICISICPSKILLRPSSDCSITIVGLLLSVCSVALGPLENLLLPCGDSSCANREPALTATLNLPQNASQGEMASQGQSDVETAGPESGPLIWNPYIPTIYLTRTTAHTFNPKQTRQKRVRAQIRFSYLEP